MGRLTISNNAKLGQLVICIIFLGIFSFLILLWVLTGNLNYLLMVGFALVFFSPPLLFIARLYDCYIDGNYFYFSNLISTSRIEKSLFKDVQPMRGSFLAINNPYFTIIFTNGKRFHFINRKWPGQHFLSSRKSKAEIIKKSILEIVIKSS